MADISNPIQITENGRFYPCQRDNAHATVLLLSATPYPAEDGPLRFGFWLPQAGYHLLVVQVDGTDTAVIDNALSALTPDNLPDGVKVDRARLVGGSWGASADLLLRYAAANLAIHHLFIIAGGAQTAPELTGRRFLLLGGWQDETAPLERHLLPLYRALQQTEATAVDITCFDADHHFSGKEFTLAKTIWEWMQRVLPAADAPGRDAVVSLREISGETARDIMRLKVTPEQRQFVASNEISIAQAYFQREHAWFRAIYADETPVGFLMLYDNPEEPTYFLWRFMIDVRYQGLGYGRKAVDRLIEHVKTRPGAEKLLVSCVPGAGSPCPFYERMGFTYTGEEEGIELVMSLKL